MAVLEDLGTYIAAQTSLTLGTDLFQGRMPEAPDACVAIYDSGGGLAPERAFGSAGLQYESPSVMVHCRAATRATAKTNADAVFTALGKVMAESLSSTVYHMIRPQQSPTFLEWDDNDRAIYTFNVVCEKEMG